MEDRLDKLRGLRCEGWKELAFTLGITVTMLHYLRTGERNPSPKLLRRIMELETKAGLSVPPSRPLLAKESPVEYTPSVERKHLDIVQIRRQVTELERQIAALKRLLEDSNADNG